MREWRQEVAARERLEEENARLRIEIDQLKAQSRMPRFFRERADLKLIRTLKLAETAVQQRVERDLQRHTPNNDGP